MIRIFFFPIVLAVLTFSAQEATPPGQSVADAARAARERQKNSPPKHLLTDDDIAARHASSDSAELTGNEAQARAQLENSVSASPTAAELQSQADKIRVDANEPANKLIATFQQTALSGYEGLEFPGRQEWEDQLESATTRFLSESAAAASRLQALLDSNHDALSRQDAGTLQKLRSPWIEALVPCTSWQMRTQQLVVDGQARAKAYMADSAAAWRDYRRAHVKQAEAAVAATMAALREQEAAFQKSNAHYTCEMADFPAANGAAKNPANSQLAWNTRMDTLRETGYSIVLQGCDAEHFTALAAAPAPDGTQGRAFCGSESAAVYIALDGRTANCLTTGREWHGQ